MIQAIFALALLLLIAADVLTYRSADILVEAGSRLKHTDETVSAIDDLYAMVLEIQYNQRSYQLTGREQFAAACTAAEKRIDQIYKRLQPLVEDYPLQRQRLDELRSLVARRIQLAQEAIEARSQRGFDANVALQTIEQGAPLREQILAVIAVLKREERNFLQTHDQAARTRTQQMTMAAVAGSGLAVILGGFGAFVLMRDLDRRRKTEHALTHEQELSQGIIDNIPVMITIYNPNLRDFQLNREFVRVLGWSTEAARRMDLMEKCFPDSEYRKTARQYMQSLQPGWRDFRVTAKDGNVVESSWANIRLSDDTLIGIGIDIRERKKAEETLRRSEQLNVATLNALPAHIAVLDRGGTILMVNDAWTEFVRRNGDLAAVKVSVGANYLSVCRQTSGSQCPEAHEVLEGIQTVLDGRQLHFTMEYPCHSPDEQRWFLMNVVPLRAATGGAVVTHLDITDRRLAEQALHQAKEYAEHLLAVAGVIFVVLDEQGRIQILNRKGCEILGCSETEAIGKDWINTFIPERLRLEIRRVFQQVAAGDLLLAEYYENPILSGDGQERLIAWHNTVLRDDLGKVFGVLSSGQDISAERKNLTALLESEERFRVMAETVPDILFTARPDGWRDYFNVSSG